MTLKIPPFISITFFWSAEKAADGIDDDTVI